MSVFISDISQAGQINYTAYVFNTIAGIPDVKGFQDETAIAAYDALFYYPGAVAVDTNENIYVADTFNNAIRKLTPAGTNWVVTTIATNLNYPMGIGVDRTGNVYVANTLASTILKLTPGSTNWVTTTLVSGLTDPTGVAVDGATNLYISELNYTVQKFTPAGVLSTLAGQANTSGSNNGTGAGARFKYLAGISLDSATNVYVVDSGNNAIRKITPAGVVTTIAGYAGVSGSQDGIGTNAWFNDPQGLAVDSATNIYVTDYDNHTIRKISSTGVVTTLGGVPGLSGNANGAGVSARFYFPEGIAVDKNGRIFIADSQNETIRQGVITPPVIVNGSGVFTGGNFGLELTGLTGQTVVVQESTNLMTWAPVWTNILSSIPVTFTDTNPAVKQLFYRAVIP